MTVQIFGADGCEKCENAKKHASEMGFEYEFVQLADRYDHHEGWRENGSRELVAFCESIATDHIPLPVLQVQGEYMEYTQAMRAMKKIAKERKASARLKKEAS